MEILVTVIVPVYKVEKYLKKCLDSIIGQTYEHLQIILINDGSPDGCGEICNNYAKNDYRIQVIHKNNGGLSDARNVGINYAKGKYILFVDSDDFIESDAIERLVQYAEKYKLEIVSANALKVTLTKSGQLVNINFEKEKIMTGEQYMSYCISQGDFAAAVCIRLYSSNLIKKNKIYFVKGLLHEDENWTPKILLKTKRMMQVDYVFYNYIIRENSITQSINKEKNILDIFKTCKELERLYNDEKLDDTNRKLFLDYLARMYMATSIFGKYDNSFYTSHFDKKFVKRNTFLTNTKIKATLFRLSVHLYRLIKLKFG